MRILRIKFENLNSLPSGDIDLERGPLASAGIFAITGPTGAGKSTLLDAITLALYGRAARYDGERNPENMMSRHAGSCLAEVLFEVPRGRFQARWERRRARGKAGGKIQNAKRTVTEDATGTVLVSRIDQADRLIEELTGLDYDRFLRSALLAQGEFSRFLKASSKERAELLESLTGTVVYSRLGELAYREAARRKEDLAIRQEALGRIVPLAGEERTFRAGEIERLGGALESLRKERAETARKLDEGRQKAARLGEERQILSGQAALAAEAAGAAPRFERLKLHQSAQPFAGLLQTLDALEAQAAAEAVRRDNAKAALAEARVRLASGLRAARALAEEWIAASDREIGDARLRQKELDDASGQTVRWLEEHAADAGLEAAAPELAERINRTAEIRRELARLAAEGAALDARRREGAQRFETAQTGLAQAGAASREAADRLQHASAAVSKLLHGRSREALDEEFASLGSRRETLVRLKAAMEKRDAAAAEAARLADEEAHLVGDIEQARLEKAATEQEAEAQRALLESARAEVELQRQMAGMSDQRAQLKEGQPCPLCGALEHPYARPQFSASLEEALRNLKAARTASESADKEAVLAAQGVTRAEERLNAALRRRGELRWQQTADHEAFEQIARSVRIYTAEAIDEAFAEIDRAAGAHRQLIQALREAEALRHEAERTLHHHEKTVEGLREKCAAEEHALADLNARLAAAAEQGGSFNTLLETESAELEKALAPYGAGLPGSGEEAVLRRRLEARRQEYARQAADRTRLESERGQLAVRLESLIQRREEQCRHARNLASCGEIAPGPEERPPWRTLDQVREALEQLRARAAQAETALEASRQNLAGLEKAASNQAGELRKQMEGSAFDGLPALRAARLPLDEAERIARRQAELASRAQALKGQLTQVREQLCGLSEAPEGEAMAALEDGLKRLEETIVQTAENRAALTAELARDDETRRTLAARLAEWEEDRRQSAVWNRLSLLIGSADGSRFQQFAQGLSLDLLVRHANRHLTLLSDRYRLRRAEGGEPLMLEIVDLHQANAVRPMRSLSGGESFLASLALALGLADLAGRNVRIDSLFIDEGFGSLDAATLDLAVAALEALRLSHKTVGVISHVDLLKERIPVQIRIEKKAGGVSVIHLPQAA